MPRRLARASQRVPRRHRMRQLSVAEGRPRRRCPSHRSGQWHPPIRRIAGSCPRRRGPERVGAAAAPCPTGQPIRAGRCRGERDVVLSRASWEPALPRARRRADECRVLGTRRNVLLRSHHPHRVRDDIGVDEGNPNAPARRDGDAVTSAETAVEIEAAMRFVITGRHAQLDFASVRVVPHEVGVRSCDTAHHHDQGAPQRGQCRASQAWMGHIP